MAWSLKGQYLQKSALAILDIIANNNWERPVYFVSPYGDGDIGIADYFQLEGFAYRLVPIKTSGRDFLSVGRIDTDILYNNLMNKFSWGRMNEPDVFIDYNNQRTAIVLKLRNTFSRLAQQLISEGKKDSALVVLDKITKLMPHEKYPYDFFMFDIAEAYYKLNQTETANKILDKYADVTLQSLRYQLSLGGKFKNYNDYDIRLNIQTLQELASLADSYGQVELKGKIENGLNQHYSKYINAK